MIAFPVASKKPNAISQLKLKFLISMKCKIGFLNTKNIDAVIKTDPRISIKRLDVVMRR